MKIYRSRFAAALAAVILAAGCFSGCGKGVSDSSSAAETTAITAEITSPPAESSAPDESIEAPAGESAPDTSSASEDGSAPEPEEEVYAPAMWKVTSQEGGVIYMMGSMHALKEECYPLPGYVQSAFDDCDVLAVEYDMTDINQSFAASHKYSDKMSYSPGETARDHLTDETWKGLCTYLRHYGEDPAAYESMNLWYIYSAIQNFSLNDTGLSSAYSFDNYLLNAAHESDKEIYNIESAEFQLGMFAGFSDDVYNNLIGQYSAENIDNLNDSLLAEYHYWRTGDVNGADPGKDIDLSEADEEEKAYTEEFMNTLYYDRNRRMAEEAEKLTKSGKKVLYVVGLGHYPGEKGIINIMQKDGYTLERVTEYP